MGYTRTWSFFERFGRQRIGIRFVEASVASRSEADTNALGANFGLGWPTLGTLFGDFSEPTQVLGRPHALCVRVPKLANQQASKTNDISSSVLQLQADRISDECLADKPFAPTPFDLPVAPHTAYLPPTRIFQDDLPELRRLLRTVNLCWHPLSQSFVWSNLVVNSNPSVGAPLLSSRMSRSRLCRLGLEDPMHLLVSAVLFWMPWSDKFHADSQRRPPRAQARKPKRPGRSEGRTIVHPDDFGVTIVSKQSKKNAFDHHPMRMLEQANGQQVTTEKIPHGQRIHWLPIAGSKPAFEIHSPNLVASASHRQRTWLELRTPPATSVPTPAQFHHLQPLADRPSRWHTLSGKFLAQSSRKLATAPTPIPSPRPPNAHQPFGRNLSWRALWASGPIPKAAKPLSLETLLPFVASLATDPKQPTQLRHVLLGLQSQLHKMQPPNYRRHFLERHAPVKGRK
jgi:hypothetical protein